MAGRREDGAGLPAAARRVAEATDLGRVLGRIGELTRIGGGPGGGVTRLAFSDEESRANDLFAEWMREAGLTVAHDAIGNIFGSTDGNAPGVAPIAAGSHLDTVPNGGRYDGPLGIIGALETIEAMRDAGVAPARPMELIVWRGEEPSRFASGRIGSQVFAGTLAIDDLLPQGAAFDLAGRLRAEAALGRTGRAPGRGLAGYLELHIEQGKRLEESGAQIGVVTAIAAATRLRIDIVGAADHSGATPMGLRRDALCAAADLVLATERAGLARRAENIVATAVRIAVEPGALNVVPGRAELWLDVRGIEAATIMETVADIRRAGEAIAAARGVAVTFTEVARGVPVRFDAAVVDAIEGAARALGHSTMRLPSGAGHDAQTVAPLAPSGMIFVPSRGGISHAPDEYTAPEEIARGVRVLAAEWARLALADGPASRSFPIADRPTSASASGPQPRANEIRVLGVDLAVKAWGDNGSALLSFLPGPTPAWGICQPGAIVWPEAPVSAEAMADAIDTFALAWGVTAVSLDGPQGWRDPEAAARPGVGRRCEYEARTPGKTGTFGQVFPRGYTGWVSFCIAVFRDLLARPHVRLANDGARTALERLPRGGYYLLECFPTSTWRTSGLIPLPGHRKAPPPVVAHHAETLRSAYGLAASAVTDHHDNLQAVAAALPAAALLGGPCIAVPRGEAAREWGGDGDRPAHLVEGIIWDAAPQ